MSRLRAAAPAELAGEPVTSVTDYSGGTLELPSADMLSYQLPGARVVIRPSGTEPKIKAYLEVVELVTGRTLAARQPRPRMAAAHGRHRPARLRRPITIGRLDDATTWLPVAEFLAARRDRPPAVRATSHCGDRCRYGCATCCARSPRCDRVASSYAWPSSDRMRQPLHRRPRAPADCTGSHAARAPRAPRA